MATRRALVNINGQTQELPAGDDLAGAGTFSGSVVFNGILTPAAITADQNDYSPINYHLYNVLRLEPSGANRELTGLDSTNVVGGQAFIIVNISSGFSLKLKNNNNNSLAANRFLLKADITLEKEEAVVVWYDATNVRWRIAATNV